MAVLSPFGPFRAFDSNGDPLNGGKLYTYEAGTSTPKTTYSDSTGLIGVANTNPVILDQYGYANVWLGSGGYKFILKTSADATLWTIDNIGGDSENAFGSSVVTTATNLAITSTHQNALVRCTAALTLSLLSATTADQGFYFLVTNASSGNVTIDPDASETIDGAATFTIYPGDSAIIICNGSAWFSAFSIPAAGITTDSISTTGASGVVVKNSAGATVATLGASAGTVAAFAGNVTSNGEILQAAPTGSIMMFAGSSAPTNWLLCYGQAVSRTTYANLYAVVGTTYGSGDGSTTFNLPDMRGRTGVGKDNMGGSAANRITSGGSGITGTTLGATGGTETHVLTTAQLASHTHEQRGGTTGTNGMRYETTNASATLTASGIQTASAGSDQAHQNTQPSIILNMIIRI